MMRNHLESTWKLYILIQKIVDEDGWISSHYEKMQTFMNRFHINQIEFIGITLGEVNPFLTCLEIS